MFSEFPFTISDVGVGFAMSTLDRGMRIRLVRWVSQEEILYPWVKAILELTANQKKAPEDVINSCC